MHKYRQKFYINFYNGLLKETVIFMKPSEKKHNFCGKNGHLLGHWHFLEFLRYILSVNSDGSGKTVQMHRLV